jgi:hypothetical protein
MQMLVKNQCSIYEFLKIFFQKLNHYHTFASKKATTKVLIHQQIRPIRGALDSSFSPNQFL